MMKYYWNKLYIFYIFNVSNVPYVNQNLKYFNDKLMYNVIISK